MPRPKSALTDRVRYLARKLSRPRSVRVDGIVACLDDPAIPEKIKKSLYANKYEFEERQIVARNLEWGDVVLDIGGGMGLVSILCAQRLGDGSRVHCFEANPDLERIIRRNFQANGVAPHLEIALVSDREGEQEFFVHPKLIASSRFALAGARPVSVQAVTFASLLRRIRPTFLIVDIEGAEVDIFAGVDLAGVQKICLETHPEQVGDAAVSTMIHRLIGAGFSLVIPQCLGATLFFERQGPP